MDASDFIKWLVEVDGKAEGSALTYGSLIRSGVAKLGENPSKAALEDYVAKLPVTGRGPFRAAWRAFVRFSASQGAEVENVEGGRVGRPALNARSGSVPPHMRMPVVPLDVTGAITYFLDTGAASALRDGTWLDVRMIDKEKATLHYSETACTYHLPRAPLDALRAWGKPTTPMAPLVPDDPGLTVSMDWNAVVRIWRVGHARKLRGEELPFADLPSPKAIADNPPDPALVGLSIEEVLFPERFGRPPNRVPDE